ncbi:MAG TPA: SEC-C metal-binding domain-containing protein, partial [Microthrixaceae bacterium]|nr:SEC-C metal-binding domain-containing protein [Microthrixaceae bacterium]
RALAEAVDGLLETHCSSEYAEEWDLEALIADTSGYWPTSLTPQALSAARASDDVYDILMSDATRHYEEREQELGEENLREIERQVMLKVIDARWRDHLKEMDYLQEGINLRALGQVDPLTEWQREGFDMFGQLMSTVDREYVQYVMHVQIVKDDVPAETPTAGLSYSSPDGPGGTPVPAMVSGEAGAATAEAEPAPQKPVVKTEWEKTPRNAPCPCGSGKKYKACHGA